MSSFSGRASYLTKAGIPNQNNQTFRTEPVPNMRSSLYRLTIRLPRQYVSAAAQAQSGITATYLFPLSPENLQRTHTGMGAFYDTQGPVKTNGVTRIVDQYGMAPVIFEIKGTTGWQKHSTDGYRYTGLQSIEAVAGLLNTYMGLNAELAQEQRSDLCTLEFYDYFMEDFWEVVPLGPQRLWLDKQRPILTNYHFRLIGVRSLAAPVTPKSTADPIAAAFNTAVSTVQNNVSTFTSGVASIYSSAQSVVSGVIGGL
ncbi:MAG: hypothetical protein M0Z85_08745 [Gammaproteobacteria bacterium]|nr:hypothetical protein [Gammaproteobacteria bacterium]